MLGRNLSNDDVNAEKNIAEKKNVQLLLFYDNSVLLKLCYLDELRFRRKARSVVEVSTQNFRFTVVYSSCRENHRCYNFTLPFF